MVGPPSHDFCWRRAGGVGVGDLWKVFSRLGIITDVFMPIRAGEAVRFSFVRYWSFEELQRVLRQSEKLRVKGKWLFVAVAKRRYGVRQGQSDNHFRVWEERGKVEVSFQILQRSSVA